MSDPGVDCVHATKVDALLADARQLLDRLGDRLIELEALNRHDPTPGQQIAKLFETWSSAWRSRYGTDYIYARQRDAGNFKRLLKTIALEEVQARMRKYLQDRDQFLANQRHPLALFVSQINRWAPTTGRMFDEGCEDVIGCHHTPRCGSDAEHTRKALAERRAQS